MRSAVLTTVVLLLLSTVGCCQSRQVASLPGPQTPALLFDAHPGLIAASDVAFRSPWPSTRAYYGEGEDIYFRERFIDLQQAGRCGLSHDRVYRRFETRRIGWAHR